jgi:YbbR domain-containing protein
MPSLGDASRTAGLAAAQVIDSLRNNWGTGLLSVGLAVALWVFVTSEENPDRTERVPGAVPINVVNVPEGQAVFSLSEPSVVVRSRAPESVHETLTAEDFEATVDLSGVTSRTATVRVEVESNESRAEVVDVTPADVTVTLESITTRTVPVETDLVGTPPPGYDIGAITVDPIGVEVTGPESLVGEALLESVIAEVNLTGVRNDIQQTVLLEPRDAGGNVIAGVDVEPESARVSVTILQIEQTRRFAVRPVIEGSPAPGYNVSLIGVQPALVEVTGSAEALSAIDGIIGIPTDAISIEGATESIEGRSVALQLPEGVSSQVNSVTVTVSIVPARGQQVFSVVPRLNGLDANLMGILAPSSVQVILSGELPVLQGLNPEDIAVTVNVSGRDAGTYNLPVSVQAPAGSVLVSFTPAQVRVTLTTAP